MIKIAYLSDAHLELQERNFAFPDADVLLLAGDICVVADLRDGFCDTTFGINQRQFLRAVSVKYKTVIWIPGNHEYYNGNMSTNQEKVNNFLKSENLTNITYIPMGCLKVNDIKFVFASLWTDINKGNPIDISCSGIMNDYQQIMINDDASASGIRYLTPDDTMRLHTMHRDHIKVEVVGHDKVVVMTHHAPHILSAGDRRIDRSSVFYCCTDMEDVILDNPQIKFWIAGHTHNKADYFIGDAQILSNPRGYPSEKISKSFIIETITL